MNIKCLHYARYSTSIPINTIILDSSNKALQTDVEKVITLTMQIAFKIKALKSKVGERDKLRTAYGVWYVTYDDNDVSYAVCTIESYPERHAYALIERLQEKMAEINHCVYETEENIKSHTKKMANELTKRYNDLSLVDKLHKAQDEV